MGQKSSRFEGQTYHSLYQGHGEESLGPWPIHEVQAIALHTAAAVCCRCEALSREIASVQIAPSVLEAIKRRWVGVEEGPSSVAAWSQDGQL